jgi:tetratricopeptide (TPR) repeat protein
MRGSWKPSQVRELPSALAGTAVFRMKGIWLLLLVWPLVAADWLQEARERGTALENGRQWADACTVYRSALARLGPAGPLADRYWLLTSLAEVTFEQQDYGQTRHWLRAATDAIRSLPPDAPEQLRLLTARGALYLVEGNLTAAERDLAQAAASRTSLPARDRAAALHNLAAVEMHSGRLREASTHEKQALTIWRCEFGDRSGYVVKAWISLSSLQGLSGDWRAAETSLRHALAGGETPEALANYAIVLEKLKRRREAREIRRRLPVAALTPAPLTDVKAMPYETGPARIRTR